MSQAVATTPTASSTLTGLVVPLNDRSLLLPNVALAELMPEDRLAAMYVNRTSRLLENKQGRDWKAIMRFKDK